MKPDLNVIMDADYIDDDNNDDKNIDTPPPNYKKCETCLKYYTKQNFYHHSKTQYHIIYKNLNQKFLSHVIL